MAITIKQQVRNALKYLKEYGWRQNSIGKPNDGPVCVSGAICYGNGVKEVQYPGDRNNLLPVVARIAGRLGRVDPLGYLILTNDGPTARHALCVCFERRLSKNALSI